MLLLTFFMCPTHDQGLVRLPLAYSRSRFPPAPAPACRYGGGNVGLMGAIAETVGRGLGEEHVIGVIPAALAPREISGTTVGEIRLVEDMHTRKAMMFDLADAFISIPGGFGTLDETVEITTWHQLGFHAKPVGILNTLGYFDHLLAFFDHATAEGFVRPASRAIVVSDSDPAALIDKLMAYEGETWMF